MRRTKPIPPHATMVFKGKIFEVWQWEQELFDGTTATFERLRRPDTVEILATVGDKIFVQKEQQPDTGEFVSTPAGRVDEGESPERAAQRELLEETGYVSEDWELIEQEMPLGKMEWTIHLFVARECTKKQDADPGAGEKVAPFLVSFDELLNLSDDPTFRSITTQKLLWHARLDERKKDALHRLLFKH